MGNIAPLLNRKLGSADIEVAVDLQGVAVDHLAIEFLGNAQSKRALTGAGGAYDDNERRFGHSRSERCRDVIQY